MRAADAGSGTLEVDGRSISFTNLDKVVYPSTGTTKADVLQYYLAVAPVMLPHLRDRIITRRKWPDGVTGEVFYEKNLPTWAPDWLRTLDVEHSDRTVTYPVARDRADLVWLAQSGTLEFHTPQWTVGPRGAHRGADRLVLDLDPGEPAGLAECASVAVWLRDRLAEDGADAFPVTSGSKGLQLYARWPIPGITAAHPSEYAKKLAAELGAARPNDVVATMTRSERAGRVYVDWSQNNPAKTTITPYSLRGRERPWAAAPRTWDEITSGDLEQLEYTEVLRRAADGDPLAPLAATGTKARTASKSTTPKKGSRRGRSE